MRSFFVTLFTVLGGIFGCTSATDGFESINPDEFERVIADSTVLRLDVRTAEEYADGHIAGTINIDVMGSDFEQKALAMLDKERTIALYCRSGRRSKRAARILVDNGFRVVELSKGFNSWTDAGKPIEK